MSTRTLALFAMAVLLALAALTVWVRQDLAAERLRLDGVRACLTNTAYPRSLLGQCLDDYAVMRADGLRP